MNRAAQQGFTLLEMIVVLVIIGMLMGLVGPRLFNQADKAKAQTADTQVKMLKGALLTMRLDIGRLPTEEEGLALLNTPPSDERLGAFWHGPYLEGGVPLDPGTGLTCTATGRVPNNPSLSTARARMGSPVGKAWMPMSVTRPNVDQAAFTLLELLVVLVIVGAIAAVALPGLVRMQETWARRTALDDLFNQLQTLGYRVRSDGRELLIGESGAVPEQLLRLPDGWTVTARPPIRYMANGVCLGGKLQVHHGRATHTLLLQPPSARPGRSADAGAAGRLHAPGGGGCADAPGSGRRCAFRLAQQCLSEHAAGRGGRAAHRDGLGGDGLSGAHEPCARTRRQGPAGALPAGVAKFAAVRVESGGGPP